MICDKKTVLLFHGRKKGHTRQYLEQVLTGIEFSDLQVVQPSENHILPCTGCNACRTGPCILRDDMDKLTPILTCAELLILATPIYFASLPAQVKLLADRLQPQFYQVYGGGVRKGKKIPGLLLSTQGSEDMRDSQAFQRGASMLLNTLGCPKPAYFPLIGCDRREVEEGSADDARAWLRNTIEEGNSNAG